MIGRTGAGTNGNHGLGGRLAAVIIISLVIVVNVGLAMALTVIPVNNNVNLFVSNDAGTWFDDNGNDAYNFFNTGQSATQGQNALHISHNNISKLIPMSPSPRRNRECFT